MPQTKQQVVNLIQLEMGKIDDQMQKIETASLTHYIDPEWNKLLFAKQLLLTIYLKANQ